MAEEFRHNLQAQQFEAWVDGEYAGEISYLVMNGAHIFDHTYIEPDKRVPGLSSRLATYAFQVARAGVWKVQPLCPFVQRWLEKNHDFDDLLVYDAWTEDQ